ncbi:MAG: Wzz/FepE/Etk N-terminal domain-containing protein, partial [Candidatus Paceibacterota bacterium]
MTENPNDKTPEKPEIRYVPIEYLPHMHDDDDEIDLIELIRTIWNERTLIYKTVGVFIVIGLMVALGSREEYTSEIKLMPESQQGSSMGGLGGLARQFGVNTGTRETREGIPPSLYPDVTRSLVVMQRLMDYEVEVQGQEEPVTLYAYFREHQSSSTLATVKKYTIRLPFTILGGIRSLFRSETTSELSDLDRELAGEEETRRIIRM